MSREIGRVGQVPSGSAQVFVFVSLAGVEFTSNPRVTFDPCDARNLANHLERAADEVERMRDGREYGDLLRRADELLQRTGSHGPEGDILRELVAAVRGQAPRPPHPHRT